MGKKKTAVQPTREDIINAIAELEVTRAKWVTLAIAVRKTLDMKDQRVVDNIIKQADTAMAVYAALIDRMIDKIKFRPEATVSEEKK